jgi:hypothetical protein
MRDGDDGKCGTRGNDHTITCRGQAGLKGSNRTLTAKAIDVEIRGFVEPIA